MCKQLINTSGVNDVQQVINDTNEAIDNSPHGADWHKHWITCVIGEYKSWEPDNTCIYIGTSIDDACNALNQSNFGEE